MRCPRCKETLQAEVFQGVEIDRCPGCRGIWLDAGELLPLLRSNGDSIPQETLDTVLKTRIRGVSEAEAKSVELCPHCGARMGPLNYDYTSGVIIDSCPNEHGIWLDAGELERIRAHAQLARQTVAERGAGLQANLRNVAAEAEAREAARTSGQRGILAPLFSLLVNKLG